MLEDVFVYSVIAASITTVIGWVFIIAAAVLDGRFDQ
jgi:hypothetical protein